MNKSNIQLISARIRCARQIFISFSLTESHPFLFFLLVPFDVVEFGGKEKSYRRASDADKDFVSSIIYSENRQNWFVRGRSDYSQTYNKACRCPDTHSLPR